MTPNKLPPLPEPIAHANKMQLRAVESADIAILGRNVLMSRSNTNKRSDPLFTADQMHTYGKLCSAEAFQLYVDANEARIDAELALRQSQSLPAGAVADGPVFYVGRVYDCDAGEDRGEIHPTLPANLIGKRVRLVPVEQALQADAREKGEAEYPEAAIVCAEAYQVVGCLLDQLGLFETEEGQKILDNLSQQRLVHKDVLPWGWTATQPAQASEKDGCVSVPRDALLTEARRLRYRATETYGLGPARTDAGAQMIHTAEALEGFASSGQEKE